MTRGSIQEYTEAVKGRYPQVSKKEKGMILDKFTQVTGYHRKAAVPLLHRGKSPPVGLAASRPRRYGPEVAEALNRVYDLLRLYINFFQPVMKLVTKTRHGAKVHKVYETARTPYQRLLEAGLLTQAKQQEMAATYCGLNHVSLRGKATRIWSVYVPWQYVLPGSLKPDLVGAR